MKIVYMLLLGAAGFIACWSVDQTLTPQSEIKLDAPMTAGIGELVQLDVSNSIADSFQWKVIPQVKNFRTFNDGRIAVFSAETVGEYTFIVAASRYRTVDVAVWTITVGSPAVEPDVSPASNKLAQRVGNWLDSVTSPTKRVEALALADAYEQMAASMRSGQLTSIYEVSREAQVVTEMALGDSLDEWKPFRDQLQRELMGLIEEGKLDSEVWTTIAKALR